jgi:hypothetical protein
MTATTSTGPSRRSIGVGILGVVVAIGLVLAGIAAGTWPAGGGAVVLLGAALVGLVGLALALRAPDRPTIAGEVGLGGTAILAALALVQAVQGIATLLAPVPSIELPGAALGVGVGLAAIVGLAGAGRGRALRRLIADPWRRGDGGVRIAIAGGVLEVVAWLALVGLSGTFGIGFAARDPLPALGLALALLAVLLVTSITVGVVRDRFDGLPALVAVLPAAGAVGIAVYQFSAFVDALQRTQGELFDAVDTVSFYGHLAAVAVVALGVLVAAVGSFRGRRAVRTSGRASV